MEALAEANSDAREVNDALRIGGNIALGIDDTIDDIELEEEWMALVKEAEAAETLNEAENMDKKLEEVSKAPTSTPVGDARHKEKVGQSVALL